MSGPVQLVGPCPLDGTRVGARRYAGSTLGCGGMVPDVRGCLSGIEPRPDPAHDRGNVVDQRLANDDGIDQRAVVNRANLAW